MALRGPWDFSCSGIPAGEYLGKVLVNDLVYVIGIIGHCYRYIVAHGMDFGFLQQRYFIRIVLGVNAVIHIGLHQLTYSGRRVLILAGKTAQRR